MNLTKTIKSITGTFKKLSTCGKILLLVTCILIVLSIFRSDYSTSEKEGFEQKDQFIFKRGPSVYDNFYANVYNNIFKSTIGTDFEIGTIINSTIPSSESVILDVGCRTGSRVSKLSDQNLEVIGIDVSPFMIKKSLMNYPDHRFIVGDALKIGQFTPTSFTHILCLDNIIYTFADKQQLINNFMEWLMPGGFLILHLVDIESFNPVVSNNNKTSDYYYTANYELNNNIGTITEKFQFKNGRVRKQEQKLYMDEKEVILTIIQQCGFTLHSIVDMLQSGYSNQYIYIFVKL
jgi:SAM-dependent methyltransferase